MAVIGGPDIVQDGLVFYMDPANYRSYPGSGTTWTDIVGRKTATLTNGPTFSTIGGGSIAFDGANDYAALTTTGLLVNSFCLSMWIYPHDVAGGFQMLWGADGYAGGTGLGHYIYNNTVRPYIAVGGSAAELFNSNANLTNNTWFNVVLQRNKSVKWELYIDGVLDSTNSSTALADSFSATNTRIGQHSGGNLPFDGNMSHIILYDRVLTPAEILENYNEFKDRFE